MIDLPSTAPPSRDGSRVGRSMRIVGMLSEQQAYGRIRSSISPAAGINTWPASRARRGMKCDACCGAVFDGGDVEYIRHRPGAGP